MASYTPVLISADTLSAVVGDIFRANGCDTAEADRIAHHLLGANLAGHDSHGVARVPRYVEWQQAGHVVAGQQAEVVTDGGAFAVLDGHFGFGQTVAPQAAALGIERAQQHGTAIIALRNAGHVGRIGAYAEQAIEAGLISIHFVNVAGSVLVAPFGGTALPHDALVEPDGSLSSDPHTLYGDYDQIGPRNATGGAGAIRAFGEHKGSGLALVCDLLAGAFTGGGSSGPVKERGRIANGMLSIYISPRHFGSPEEFLRTAEDYVAWVKTCKPIVPGGEVLAPGEPEARLKAERLAKGVPLQPDTWASIVQCARALGVTVPN
jgi:uncharacterized oxidoreductase